MKSIRWYHAEIEYQTKASNHRCHHFVGQLDLNASISQLTDFVSPIARILSARNARQTREYIIFTRGHPLTVASSLEIFSFNSIALSKQFGPIGVYCFKPGNSIRLYITFPSFQTEVHSSNTHHIKIANQRNSQPKSLYQGVLNAGSLNKIMGYFPRDLPKDQ